MTIANDQTHPSEVSSTLEGDLDLQGILGVSPDVRTGLTAVRLSSTLKGDGANRLRDVVDQPRRRSAVLDMLTNGVPVRTEVEAA